MNEEFKKEATEDTLPYVDIMMADLKPQTMKLVASLFVVRYLKVWCMSDY